MNSFWILSRSLILDSSKFFLSVWSSLSSRILTIPFKKIDAYHNFISGFRMLWIFITSQQRCLDDLCNGTVCLPGHPSWIHFSQSLQKFWRGKVEIKCPFDFNAVSRHCICSFLCYEFGVVVSTSLNTYISIYLCMYLQLSYIPTLI